MVVIVNYGQIVKKFGSEASARDYFDSLTAKRHHVWLVTKDVALKLGFI